MCILAQSNQECKSLFAKIGTLWYDCFTAERGNQTRVGQGRLVSRPLPGRPSFFLLLEKPTARGKPKERRTCRLYDYEIALIVRPEIEEEGQQSLIERLSELLTSAGGEVTEVENWGRRRLAYPIRKIQEGFYYFIQGKFSASVLPELERVIRLNEDILRHMVIRTDI